ASTPPTRIVKLKLSTMFDVTVRKCSGRDLESTLLRDFQIWGKVPDSAPQAIDFQRAVAAAYSCEPKMRHALKRILRYRKLTREQRNFAAVVQSYAPPPLKR
ncbi:MAG: hypothetical protein M3463_03115, partial [Verrucomicrobiota bacterium]|nr:hypothetical protein [Verrucomicrobiota bacterium]